MPNSDYQYRIGQIFKAIHFLIGLGNEMLKGVFLTAFFTTLYRCKKFIPLVFYFVKLLS